MTPTEPPPWPDAFADLQTPPPQLDPDEPDATSLAAGPAGIALLHIERALAGDATWAPANAWVRTATTGEVSAADTVGLYKGAIAISYVLHAAHSDGSARYGPALSILDRHVGRIAHHRVDAAMARIERGEVARAAEYDLFRGLAGIGQLLLRQAPQSDALGRVLDYLVRLTRPLRLDGAFVPGWWVPHHPDPILPTPGGHANHGIAHGITGPLVVLARALHHGIVVDGHVEAIAEITTHLDTWRQPDPTPWWPQWITHQELRTHRTTQPGPARPSWCYGTPGIARAQQIAAIATGDTPRQARAEHALAACLADPTQLGQITDPGLCHGWAGLYQTARRAAADELTPTISPHLPNLADRLTRHAHTLTSVDNGLLTGAAGIALALRTATSTTPPLSGWDACLLIT